MKYLYNKKVLCVLAMLFVLVSCGNEKTVEPEEVMEITSDTTSADISAQIGQSPSKTETNSDTGLSSEIYNTYTFAGHNGQVSFYYNEDGSVLYYKWFITEKDEKKAKEIYSDVVWLYQAAMVMEKKIIPKHLDYIPQVLQMINSRLRHSCRKQMIVDMRFPIWWLDSTKLKVKMQSKTMF